MFAIGYGPKTMWIFENPSKDTREVYDAHNSHTLLGVAYEIAKSNMDCCGFTMIKLKLKDGQIIQML